MLKDRIRLERAWDVLYPLAMDWVFRPGVKKALLDAYDALPAELRGAYDQDVETAFRKAHGGAVTAYRATQKTDTRLGGASLTTDRDVLVALPEYIRAYRVPATAVMMHWGQKNSPLASKRYGREKEIILKPDPSGVRLLKNS